MTKCACPSGSLPRSGLMLLLSSTANSRLRHNQSLMPRRGEMKTIRQSKVIRTCKGACRVGDIVIFDVLGAAARGSGATEAAARDAARRLAEILKIPYD